MKTQFHESADLLDMLLFTVKVIATSESGDKGSEQELLEIVR